MNIGPRPNSASGIMLRVYQMTSSHEPYEVVQTFSEIFDSPLYGEAMEDRHDNAWWLVNQIGRATSQEMEDESKP